MTPYEMQLNRCCGPVPKPYLKPKPLTGIEREEKERLDSIQSEYQQEFGGSK